MKRFFVTTCGAALASAGLLLAHGCGTNGSGPGSGDGGGPGSDGGGGGSGDGGSLADGGTLDGSALDGAAGDAGDAGDDSLASARAKIKHVVIINQENRSFDHYFGTFPGADGIPMDGGVPTVCNVDPNLGTCIAPYHDRNDLNNGGPHSAPAFAECVGDGGMLGFISSAEGNGKGNGTHDCDAGDTDPNCVFGSTDVMGYHTDGEIPNYWAYAKSFALQDHMYEPVASYSLPDHLYMVSGWSATCTPASDPTSCVTDLSDPGGGGGKKSPDGGKNPKDPEYAWTDITYLLHKNGVSWKYYVAGGTEPDCEDGAMTCEAGTQHYLQPGFWNVLPWFDDVTADQEVGNVVDTNDFYGDVQTGKLAAVTWLIPSGALSEHPPGLLTRGQAYVTEIVNEIMKSPYWDSTVIFITWDDWGGFYDHVTPLGVDANGYGIRVPGLTISPWVKPGQIDKQVLSHDAYLRFIEDLFVNGARLDPASDGRPDNRPTVRENVPELGNLLTEFDFSQSPNAPLVLSPCPAGVDTIYSDAGGPCQP